MNHKVSAILLILMITGCVYGFYALYERDDNVEDLGWDQAALRSPYLAAELFLRRLGVDVQRYDHVAQLDSLPENGTVFISDSRHVLSSKRVRQLTRWVKRGGHLIVAAATPGGSETDRLLASFAIENRIVAGNPDAYMKMKPPRRPAPILTGGAGRAREHSASSPRDNRKQAKPSGPGAVVRTDKADHPTPDHELSLLRFNGIDSAFMLQFLPTRTLYHPAFDRQQQPPLADAAPIYWAGDRQGIHFMQLEVAQGLLSVLSDGVLWQSDQIDKFDHAFFLRTLARDRNGVRLLYGTRMPSLLTLIWRHAAPLVIASTLWLVAWLLYRGRRFGPLVEHQAIVRRSMAEHILASAGYRWRGGYMASLLAPVRDEIKRQARRTVASYDQLDEHTQAQCLSTYSGIGLSRIQDALHSDGKQHEDHFVETIQCLQQIRKSL